MSARNLPHWRRGDPETGCILIAVVLAAQLGAGIGVGLLLGRWWF